MSGTAPHTTTTIIGAGQAEPRGEIIHEGGITPAPGLYVLGMNFQRRRNSGFIDGVGADAWAIAERIGHAIARVA